MTKYNIWFFSSFIIALIVAMPIITIFFSFFLETSDYFTLLKNTFLFEYISNSLIILVSVITITFLLGVISAYFISFYEFPLCKFFSWALILAFAIPGYIFAFSIIAFFENYGTAYSLLTGLFGEYNYNPHIPKLDGVIGSILAISFSLFPYVYVLTRSSFFFQSNNYIEVGQNLGLSEKETLFRIILPSARPAIIAGLALVAMECLSDFGTVSIFSVSTMTTGIYNSWLSFDDLNSANQISFILLLFILVLFSIEIYSRKEARYHQPGRGFKPINKIKLNGKKSLLAFTFCSMVFLISFVFPLSQMIYWTIKFPKYIQDINILKINLNTIYLVGLSSLVLVFISLFINYGSRISKSKILNYLTNFSISGYAIPGVILAVAFITLFSNLSDIINENTSFGSTKKLFIGSIFGLILAYFIRFFSLSFNGIKSSYEKINNSIDESAYLLGYSKIKTFSRIHVPYLKNNIILIIVLISLEIIKELPITMILRPFNFETFATQAYVYASQDLLEAAALPSLFLISWSTILILFSSKYILSQKN
ncbi:MAG: iron ABC transporter permease [Candidatus Pelagibacter sp. TMED153]|nr:MAG: iron ABC transporter permease [Candidatus Pelagibacter sp. TMED153]|tara:strand:+ start:101 stop:1717 length:1617 start_codon:yes stop_codon:yes gene_type:complete